MYKAFDRFNRLLDIITWSNQNGIRINNGKTSVNTQLSSRIDHEKILRTISIKLYYMNQILFVLYQSDIIFYLIVCLTRYLGLKNARKI